MCLYDIYVCMPVYVSVYPSINPTALSGLYAAVLAKNRRKLIVRILVKT